MFRIKTDIRQYKCETKDKVEKLIRNWVIRPDDLIYDADERDWSPIGDHPAFVGLFGVLDEQEKNTPDTVVTRRSPYIQESEAQDDEEEAPREEVTMLVGRPASPDDDSEAAEEAGDEDSSSNDDVRKTDIFDEEAIAPPKPPEGVEPPAADGEVTTMTERTLDMMKVDDDDDHEEAEEEDEEPSEEVTTVREREDPPEGIEEDSEEMRTTDEVPRADRGDKTEDEDEDDTGADDKDEPESAKPTKPSKRIEPPRPKAPPLKTKKPITRKDLPEELFTTNEISSPQVREHMARLDELADAEEAEEAAASVDGNDPDATTESGRGKGKSQTVRLTEDSGVDEAWDVVADELRVTEELDAAAERSLRERSEQEESEPAEDSEGDDTVLDEPSDNFDDDFDDDEWSDDTSEPEIVDVEPFVSDGYAVPLPFAVGPTPEDLRKGMPQGNVAKGRKDAVYPIPEPKVLNELHKREFDFSRPPPRDLTAAIALGVLLIVVAIAIVARSC